MGTRSQSKDNSVARHLRAFERRLEHLERQIQDEPKRADFYAEEVRALLWLRDLANEICSCVPVEEGELQTPCWHCRTHGVLEARRRLEAKKAELAKVRRVIEEKDKAKAELEKTFFNKAVHDPLLFDVHWNTDRVSIDEIADILLLMIRRKASESR